VAAAQGGDVEFSTVPYASTSPHAEQALAEAAAGRFAQAAAELAKASDIPESERDYLQASYLARARKEKEAAGLLAGVAAGDGPLACLSALEAAAIAPPAGAEAEKLLAVAARCKSTRARAALVMARRLVGAGDASGAWKLILENLPSFPSPAEREEAVLEFSTPAGLPASDCRRRLVADLFLSEARPPTPILAEMASYWPDQADDLDFLRVLANGSTSLWRRSLRELLEQGKGGGFKEACLRGIVALQSKDDRDEALEHFSQAHRLGGSPLRETTALFYRGRTLEGLDRDLEARSEFETIVRVYPESPLAPRAAVKLAVIALREGVPLQAVARLRETLGTACPGENMAEALWLSGFVEHLTGDDEAAASLWGRLAAEYWDEPNHKWVSYGPMSLFWQAAALRRTGKPDEAEALLHLLVSEAPGTYYALRAAQMLSELQGREPPQGTRGDLGSLSGAAGVAAAFSGPNTADASAQSGEAPATPVHPAPLHAEVALGATHGQGAAGGIQASPLAVPPMVRLPEDYAGAVALFRLGLWEEAFTELSILRGIGGPAIGAGRLMLSAWLRFNQLSDSIDFRQRFGFLPSPWDGGGRLWRYSLPLSFVGPILLGNAASGLHPALIAAIIRFESGFNPRAVSSANAIGLLQVRRTTGNHVAVPCLHEKPVSGRDLTDPDRNLRLGSIYIGELLKRHHDNWALCLAAYNAGPGVSKWWVERFAGLGTDEFVEQITFPNTAGYVKRILGVVEAYWSLYYPVLGEAAPAIRLPPDIPDTLNPFLNEPGGTCAEK
jgi:tetratricopeptide (TPR) repeat protein